MDNKKFILGTIAGGVSFFFLGYLIYGIALMNFMSDHGGTATGVQKTPEQFAWWALILGNLSLGALLSYIFLKWANVNSFAGGVGAAAVICFFSSMSFDMVMLATSNIMDLTGAITDVVAFTVMGGIGGGIIGAVLGMGKKP